MPGDAKPLACGNVSTPQQSLLFLVLFCGDLQVSDTFWDLWMCFYQRFSGMFQLGENKGTTIHVFWLLQTYIVVAKWQEQIQQCFRTSRRVNNGPQQLTLTLKRLPLSWNTLSLVKQTNKQKQKQKEFSSITDPNWQELLYFCEMSFCVCVHVIG